MLTNRINEGITHMKKRGVLEGQSQKSPLKSSSLDSVIHYLFKKGHF